MLQDFIMEMVEILQKMRRESLVDFQIFYVIIWIKARLGEHTKNVFGREDYIIRRALHLKVRTASPCASESFRNFPEIWVRPAMSFLNIFVKFENGEQPSWKGIWSFHKLKISGNFKFLLPHKLVLKTFRNQDSTLILVSWVCLGTGKSLYFFNVQVINLRK